MDRNERTKKVKNGDKQIGNVEIAVFIPAQSQLETKQKGSWKESRWRWKEDGVEQRRNWEDSVP